ncbi:hypothetical protein ALI22I_00730 [Saccharothrix sp. ALI-22-I]|uniref:beta-ketoacyl-[acyl-carrier-protein] synthase family protein n=1 Tax=Saccharothrix sp. ALI-22-I TaxID=1933778 RepID=UPI00097CB5CE|nr:beta-ketoacyl-[acyl-carrier-protein] synthase family protein [Saccharothrix sp. ALI-22-I]ONI92991.1 hypothetical protein ALI22I_00730 [Saccharothrix sp. ALI-22-I]
MTGREVVVTGIGTISPLGTGVDEFFSALRKGQSGIGPLTRFDSADFPAKIAGEVRDFRPEDHMSPKVARRTARFAQFGLAAANLAVDHAGITASDVDSERVGVVVGTCYAGAELLETAKPRYDERGWRGIGPNLGTAMMPNAAAAVISMEHGFGGPVECVTAACATGAQAISRASDLIRLGHADVVLAGGCDAPLTTVAMSSFATARALALDEDPQRACKPFDANRTGLVMSEGATVFVLESADFARGRGARPLARFLGWGHSGDAYNLAQPRPDGSGAARAMRAALRMAEVEPADVGYVSAHATATSVGDVAEARALHMVFAGSPPPTSATKSMHGHLMGAAGSTGAAAALLAFIDRLLPPTINHDTADPECDLDVVANVARPASPEVVMANSFAMGGINCSLAFGRA